MADSFSRHQNADELRANLQAILAELPSPTQEAQEPLKLSELAEKRFQELVTPKHSLQHILSSGFEDYDAEFSGLVKGELLIIGARPGMGKTQLMVNLCANVAEQGKATGIISLDLSEFLLTNRFISLFTGISSQSLLKGQLSDEEKASVFEATQRMKSLPIFIYDQTETSLNSVSDRIRYLAEKLNAEVIFIDYFQLISFAYKRYNRDAELGHISRELKKLAKELNIALVVSSQLSRNVENRPGGAKRPQLSDLRESGAIEQDAEKVVFLYRAEYYGIEFDEYNQPTRNMMEVIMAKNKSGAVETIRLKIEKYFSGFYKYTGQRNFNISDDRMNDLF
jgi:replicative DNA helicase